MKITGRPVSKNAVKFEAQNVPDVEITDEYVCLIYNSESSAPSDIKRNADEIEKRPTNFLVTFEGNYEVNIED